MAFRPAPLNTGFMIAGIIGFLASVVYIYPKISPSWGFAFAVVFFAMIIASFISMSFAPAEGQLMPRLEAPIGSGQKMVIPAPPASLRSLGMMARKPKRKPAKKAKKRKSRK